MTEYFHHKEISEKIIGCFFRVYNTLGNGFLESVYERAIQIELKSVGLECKSQEEILVFYKGHAVGIFRADLIVEGKIILELKACKALEKSHEAQMLNYLKATEYEIGLLLNFGSKPQVKRFVFNNQRKNPRLSA